MSLPSSAKGTLLSAAAEAQPVGLDELSPPSGLLIVAPHPDDETFGCGEALAAAAENGREIGIVLLTDGEGSHPRSAEYDRDRLIALRTKEMLAALAILAPGKDIPIMRAGLEDGSSDLERLGLHRLQRIFAFASALGTQSVWTTWNGDPHCDHQTAATLGRMVADEIGAKFWRFPVWGRFGEREVPDDLRIYADRQYRSRKREAVEAYPSQTTSLIADDPDGFMFSQGLLGHFVEGPEIFIGG